MVPLESSEKKSTIYFKGMKLHNQSRGLIKCVTATIGPISLELDEPVEILEIKESVRVSIFVEEIRRNSIYRVF